MKSLTKYLITLSTLALVLSAPLARAQDGGPGPGPGKEHAQRGGERASPAERLEKMAKQLDLTDAQKQSILAIFQEEMTAGKALWEDKTLSKEDRRTKMQALRKDGREKIAAVLTPEQKTKFEKLHDGRHGPDAK